MCIKIYYLRKKYIVKTFFFLINDTSARNSKSIEMLKMIQIFRVYFDII